MLKEELKSVLTEINPLVVFGEEGEWLTAQVDPGTWKTFAYQLRNNALLYLDYLFCLTCIDWKTHLTMVYHLSSTQHRHTIVVKSELNRELPEIDTVCDIWKTANFHEREVFELFGVQFKGHPDLRNLILPDNWEGFPLRKDYEDPINMIKL